MQQEPQQTPYIVVIQDDPHLEVREIDQQLEKGCYSCYSYWLYLIGLWSVALLTSCLKEIIRTPAVFVIIIQTLVDLFFVSTMMKVFKKKKLKDAKAGLMIGRASMILCSLSIAINESDFASFFDTKKAALIGLAIAGVYYVLVYGIIPDKIKNLIEKREMILANVSQPNPYNA